MVRARWLNFFVKGGELKKPNYEREKKGGLYLIGGGLFGRKLRLEQVSGYVPLAL